MDESLIEETIKGYQAQLVQIRSLISAADDITKLELYDLEKDLMEMIKISEESLLETKKKNLLASLEKSPTETVLEQSNSDRLTEVNGCGSSRSQDDTSNENTGFDYVGTKCRVKYTQEWGSFQYHNAIILNCDIDDTLDDCQVKVHLLFLNPIHKSMVPCKYFLNGNCDYEATCKFSHGYIVDMEELEEYEEPDFTQLKKGGRCLAKYDEDGVWYPATVLSIQEEQATVSYDSYQETETLDFHSILPLFAIHESDDSSNEDEVNSLDQNINELPYKTIKMAGPMADWEQHTKGIGSKLMLKMGYTMGKGLGKNGDGKIDPVEIKLLPPGKSLDYIAELREKGKIKDPIKNRSKKKKLLMTNEPESAFDIINQLTHKSKANHSSNQPSCSSNSKYSVEDSYKSMKRHLKDKSKGDAKLHRKSTKEKKLNEDMFKVTEKINNLKKRLTLQKEALTRNPGDSPVSRRIKQNIEATQKEINELKKMDNSLQNKLHMKNQSKKLSVF